MSGLMSVTGERDGEPTKAGVALLDVISGLYAAVGCWRRSASATTPDAAAT